MIQHWLELRRRLMWVAGSFVGLFVLFFYFSSDVFHWILSPLGYLLPNDSGPIATQMTAPVVIPIMLAADLAFLGVAPIALFHLWQFAAPGLYSHERRGLGVTIILSLFLFCMGALFCFYAVLPFILQFFIQSVPTGVRFMPEISSAVDFITRMMMLFGFCFQVPLVCVLLVKTGLVEIATLKKARPYWIVAAFIIGMLLTPPDVLSQVTLAIPLCLLYELGVMLAKLSKQCVSAAL